MKEGWRPLPGRGRRDLGVASLEPRLGVSLESSLTEARSELSCFSLVGVERSLFCRWGPRERSDFCLGVSALFSLLGVLDDLPGESERILI